MAWGKKPKVPLHIQGLSDTLIKLLWLPHWCWGISYGMWLLPSVIRNMIWAHFSRVKTLGEMPELSVLSPENTSRVWPAQPGGQDQVGWLCCWPVVLIRGRWQINRKPFEITWCSNWKSSKSICACFFFLNSQIKNSAANLISHTGETCCACAISDKHTGRWFRFCHRTRWTWNTFLWKYQDP